MVLVYGGMTLASVLIILYYIEKEVKDSLYNTNEAFWVYFSTNIRLACLVTILGYIGLVIELSLKLKMMQSSA